ncbi:GIY-YIG nuclease family protein [Halalkalicoccus sp. NIPERK01]|uniref:GIY-YIG nuclease family protein n=1 Tax=Halalkalicoccus sp. NIPERK01 TaxID=3053469 RepID=UPI00256F3272|nr:GIY-YIG nuclease family protein [Halalkalicoccus sp. NIPERK01]MDL5363883.1 GIY-YIG nuclease family protein [Halalkalicoccus sp. NIPERK01]
MIEYEFYSSDWGGVAWSDWLPLNSNSFGTVPREPGLYRIRHQDADRLYLEYIGESGDIRRRIQSLARGVYAEEMPYRDPHTAAPCLWAIRHEVGPALEVSHVSATELGDKQQRKGLETAFIALHRRATDRSPTANFGRIISGYKQSSYSYSDPAFKGGLLDEGDEEPNAEQGIEPPNWQLWETPRAREWMGLDWSEPYRLDQRLEATPPDNGLYRIWYKNSDAPLAYIGESSAIPSRLYNHETVFGGHALFAYAKRLDLDAAHKRQEIETDLLGAYYLATNESPLAQFGYSENVPPTGVRN